MRVRQAAAVGVGERQAGDVEDEGAVFVHVVHAPFRRLIFFDHDEARRVVGFIGDSHMGHQALRLCLGAQHAGNIVEPSDVMRLAHVFARDGFFIDEGAHASAQGIKFVRRQAWAQIGGYGSSHKEGWLG